eukprot:TRINITY_DN1953_c0_g1_i1.p1 TRINITY_DN1953_c0_g1~~TRINITY_DN1953_c0_g1_i1.p1  ORF type:complete len:297 (+),score=79.24 TRINITY_DN1953_c0_g1_i1:48-938(+)
MAGSLRLITFEHALSKNLKIGVQLKEASVVDLTSSLGIKDMKTLLEERAQNPGKFDQSAFSIISSGKSRIPSSEVKIKAPIYNPEKILCVGLNYLDHAKETGMAVPAEPVCFSKFASSIIGPGDAIVKPDETNELDFEAELVVVIGKQGKHIKEAEALDYVAGYTVGHDVSARDWQLRKPGAQWMMGKTFDTFSPIGPAIVTGITDPHNLGVRAILNGQTVQNSNTKQFIFNVNKMLSYISQVVTLKPGDLIFTGTPPGVGMGRKPPLWMKPGDKVTIEIDQLGSLTNEVVASGRK